MAAGGPTKQCTLCKADKPLSDFGRHKITKDGLGYQCKQCNRERVKAYQAGLRDEYKRRKHEYDKQRWADGHGRDRSEWRRANRERMNRKSLEWVRNNPEKARAIKQSYKHRRRTQEGDGISWAELQRWRRGQKPECYWCGAKLTRKTFTVDHYTPLSKGGKHELGNLVPACRPCNLRKSAKDPFDFAREVGRLL